MSKIQKDIINREISWLHFNERVLQEAMDETTPLIERIKFLGIFSNNRDEFFRVRVATLNRVLNYEENNEIKGRKTKQILDEISDIVQSQERKFTAAYQELIGVLEDHNIILADDLSLSTEHREFVLNYFKENVRPYLFPLILKNVKNLSSLKDDSFYFAIILKGENVEDEYALVKVPIGQAPRFLILPPKDGKEFIILLDDIIRYCLSEVFGIFGYDSFKAFTIKFTRDAEMDIDNDVSKSFMEIMTESIKQRKKGVPVRFVYDREIPDKFLKVITKKFNITKKDNIRAGDRYHNFRDFMSFPRLGTPDLVYPEMPPLFHKDLPDKISILDRIKEKDIMLHFPYQSFQYIIDLLREASIDPNVRSIKMTFYRAAKDSKVMNALINAVRNGKFVTVFMELQARFDEEANIYWTTKLQEEGVKIIQTIPGYKVHCKLILIRRKEDNKNVYYTNISTGNFNESTAKVYADDSLLTANQEIAMEVNEVFHLFESKFLIPSFKHLIVSPFGTRNEFIKLLNKEIDFAKAGKKAWTILKMNSLVDKNIVQKLYAASQSGVKIILLVRGICVLKAGVKDLSENIEVYSIVDKYLEHSRVYVFANNDNPKYYISSADWMQRNFDHRVEVSCPIYDADIQKELWDMLQIQLKDNTKSRLLNPAKLNSYRKSDPFEIHRSQFETYEYFKDELVD